MAESSSDADLLGAYVDDGRESAFAELVQRHLGLVYRSALRQLGGDAHAAEDVAQAVFTLLARKAARLQDHPSLVGWLHTTTRHVARATRRATARRRTREQEVTPMNAPDDAVNWEVLGPVIDRALGELDERDRAALLLRYFSGLPFAAVGEKLGVAENAARMRVDRALDKLRDRLRRHGIDSTGAALAAALANEASGTTIPARLAAHISHAAVSAAGAGAAAAGGAAVLLSAAKLASLGFLAAVAALVGTASYGLYARHVARQQLAAAEEQLRASDERAQALSRQAAALEQRARELEAAATKAATDAADVAADAAAKNPAVWDPRAEGTAFLRRHPEVEQALRDWILAGARFHYAALLQQLHLSPADADRFLQLVSSSSTMAMPFGPGGRQLMFTLSGDTPPQSSASELQALLGKQGMRALYQYRQSLAARDDVTTLASSLAFTDAPMTAEQAAALTTAFTAASRAVKGRAQLDIDWQALTAQAHAILTPAQVPSFDTLKESILARQAQMVAMSSGAASAKPAKKP